MKKIINCMALAILLYACKKNDFNLPANQADPEKAIGKGSGNSNPYVTTTYYAPDITTITATAGGTIASGNNVSERGVCWSTGHNPTTSGSHIANGAGAGSFTCPITGLAPNTVYYVRAYAIAKNKGTNYGSELSFTTLMSPVYGTVTDYDNNTYVTIKIGTQTWMMENLKVTHFRDGTPIDNVTDNAAWAVNTTGAYCNYNNDATYVATYGRLYNWYAATNSHNLAPAGWRVPTQGDWTILETYLGGTVTNGVTPVIGRKLKEAGLAHWLAPNYADNISGFTALPGSMRNSNGQFFSYINQVGMFWSSSTASYSGNPYCRRLNNNFEDVGTYTGDYSETARIGLSVRCIKE